MIPVDAPFVAFVAVALALLPVLTFALGIALGRHQAGGSTQASPAAERPKGAEHQRRVIGGFLPTPGKQEGPSSGGHWRMVLVFSWWPEGEASEKAPAER